MEDCLKVIRSFHAKHKRAPTKEEIESLHRHGKSPGFGVFKRKGGLNILAKEAGLEPATNNTGSYSVGEVRKKFREFVYYFKKEKLRLPTVKECQTAAEEGKCPNATTLRNHTGRGFGEMLLAMGAKNRNGKEANRENNNYV